MHFPFLWLSLPRSNTLFLSDRSLTHSLPKITDISIEDFEQTWRANCGTAFLLTQLCVPDMVEKAWGRVIFCSSVAGFTGGVVGPHYAYVSLSLSLMSSPMELLRRLK
jgi:NAD(P)-dependent dehydrogenase (short-subunit alcohol dehydrogenase family)